MAIGKNALVTALIFPVPRFRGKYPSDPASRVGGVAPIARNQMDVNVGHSLAGDRAVIYADVERMRGEFAVEDAFLLADQLEDRAMLLG